MGPHTKFSLILFYVFLVKQIKWILTFSAQVKSINNIKYRHILLKVKYIFYIPLCSHISTELLFSLLEYLCVCVCVCVCACVRARERFEFV